MYELVQLSVVAPDRSVIDQPVESVVVPGTEGYFGILAGHTPLIASLQPGIVEYVERGERHYLSVSGGFAEVSDGEVTLLVDSAEMPSQIDISRAERALDQARKTLRGEGDGSVSMEEATDKLNRAIHRIRVAKHG